MIRKFMVMLILLAGGVEPASAAEGFKILQSYTDKSAPAPVNKRVVVQCAPTSIGGMQIAGPTITFYYNAFGKEWCRAAHACTKTFDEIAKRSCEERAAVNR